MRLQSQWWRGLVAAVLGGLVGVTAVAAAGEQSLPVLTMREGALKSVGSPWANGYIAYLTLLNERDDGINGVKLVWEECATAYDNIRGVECYERLKTKGPTWAAVVVPSGTPLTSNDAVGTNLDPNFFQQLGRETLRLERACNLAAGFTEADDALPAFFYTEPLAPTKRAARFHGAEVHDLYARMDNVGTEGVPDKYGRVQ